MSSAKQPEVKRAEQAQSKEQAVNSRPASKADRPGSKSENKADGSQAKAEAGDENPGEPIESKNEDKDKINVEAKSRDQNPPENPSEPSTDSPTIGERPASENSSAPSTDKPKIEERPASQRSTMLSPTQDIQSPRPHTSSSPTPASMKLDLPKDEDRDDSTTPAKLSVRNVPCEICPQLEESKTPKAEFVCTSCVERYCVRCAKRHIETPVYVKHVVVPMDPTLEDESENMEDIPCRHHKSNKLGYFCSGCQMAVCPKCITFEHGGIHHILEPISRLDSNKRILLLRYEKVLNKDLQKNSRLDTPVTKVKTVAELYWKKERDIESPSYKEEPHELNGVLDVTFFPDGQVLVANRWSNCVIRFDEDGKTSDVLLSDVGPVRLCATPENKLAVVDDYAGGQIRVLRFDEDTKEARATFTKARIMQKQSEQPPEKDKPAAFDKRSYTIDVSGIEDINGDDDVPDEKQGPDDALESGKNDLTEDGSENDNTNSQNQERQSTIVSLSAKREDTLSASFIRNWRPAGVRRPWAIAINRFNQWIVSDYEQYNRASVSIYHPDTEHIKTFGCHGERDDQFEWPGYLACDSKGRIIVSDYWNHSVKLFDSRGNFLKKIGKGWGKKEGSLTFPKGICVDDLDNIYVVDSGNNRISAFAPDGSFMRNILSAVDGLIEVEAIAFLKIDKKGGNGGETNRSQTKKSRKNSKVQTPRSETSEEEKDSSIRRLAVTMCKGRQYSAVYVYNITHEYNE